MKKKLLSSIFIIASCIFFSGCTVDNGTEIKTLSDGSTISNNDTGSSVIISKLPFDKMYYNASPVGLESIQLYQISGDYSYSPVVIVTIDKSTLTDKEFYWFNKDSTLTVDCDYSSSKNDIDSQSLSLISSYYNDIDIVFIFSDYSNEYKYDFLDMQVDAMISIKQDDTYKYISKDGDSDQLNKTNTYSCYVNDTTSDVSSDVLDSSCMSSEESEMYVDGVNKLVSQ